MLADSRKIMWHEYINSKLITSHANNKHLFLLKNVIHILSQFEMSKTYRKKQHKLHKVKMQSSNKTFQNQLKWYLLSPTAKESNVDIIHLTYLQPVARTWIAFSLDFWNSRFQCLQSTLAHPHQCLHLWTVRLAQWCKSWALFGLAILEKSVQY